MKKIFVSLVVLSLFSVAHAEDRYNAAPVDNTYVAPPVVPNVNWGKVKYITERIKKQLSSRQLQRVEEYYYSNNIFYNSKPDELSSCKGRYNVIPENQKYPLGSPIDLREIKKKINGITEGLKNHSKGWFADDYRCRDKGPHDGVDIGCNSAYYEATVYSTADGIVVYAGSHPDKMAAGIYVAIQHEDGYFTKYKHLKNATVSVGDWVGAGCPIGFLGTTGGAQHSQGSKINRKNAHLHYEIYFEGPTETAPVEHKRYYENYKTKEKKYSCSGTKFETIDPRPFVMAHGNIPLN